MISKWLKFLPLVIAACRNKTLSEIVNSAEVLSDMTEMKHGSFFFFLFGRNISMLMLNVIEGLGYLESKGF